MEKRMNWLNDELGELQSSGLYNNIRTIETAQGAWISIDGRKVLNFCSNNYLGLANDPRLIRAAKQAIDDFGVGPGAVRSIAGTISLHEELEKRLAVFKNAEAVICVQSGFCANLAVVPCLVGKQDAIFSDELNHASIIDGCRLSGAKILRYKHCDMEDLKRVIKEAKDSGLYRRFLLITDGVFSMDGDIAPLDKIADITNAEDIMLMVDDAHGEGVVGRGGRGIVDHFGLHGRVDVEVGTFSKAFGVMGGMIAGCKELIDWLHQRARPFLFSSAATPADTAACIEAVNILEGSTELVDKLWANGNYFKEKMNALGFNTGVSVTPITPVMIGEADKAHEFSAELFKEGVFGSAIGFPTVPRGKARIRVMPSAAHSFSDIDFGVAAFEKVGRRLGIL